MKNSEEFNSAGEIFSELLNSILPPESLEYASLCGVWEEIAGKELAHYVKPLDMARGFLILGTDHPGWIQKIRMTEETIIKEIERRYPGLGIKGLKIRMEKIESAKAVRSQEGIQPEPETIKKPLNQAENEKEKEFFKLLETMRQRART